VLKSSDCSLEDSASDVECQQVVTEDRLWSFRVAGHSLVTTKAHILYKRAEKRDTETSGLLWFFESDAA
jgi:hypothetical protein